MDTSCSFCVEITWIHLNLSFFDELFGIFCFGKFSLEQRHLVAKIVHNAHTAYIKTVCYLVLKAHWSPRICKVSILFGENIQSFIKGNFYRPHPKDGEGNSFSLFTFWGGGIRSQVRGGGTRSHVWGGGTRSQGRGVPGLMSGGVPHLRSGGVPVVPPRNSTHLLWLRGGRYASCVHAGGLSCGTDIW